MSTSRSAETYQCECSFCGAVSPNVLRGEEAKEMIAIEKKLGRKPDIVCLLCAQRVVEMRRSKWTN